MASNNSNEDARTLPELYKSVVAITDELDTTEESTASDAIQARLKEGIEISEKVIAMVNELSLFSINEDIDEVQTEQIKYMLMSAYLGYLTCNNTHLPRRQAVTKAIMCYKDFLRLCKTYSVTDYNVDISVEEDEDEVENIRPAVARRQDTNAMSAQRNNKIQRFKEKKELQNKLKELRVQVEKDHVDDEVKRDFYITQLKQWANYAVDEIDSCALELQMLKHREELKKSGKDFMPNANANKRKPMRPFILTKSEAQKKVFGAGYPAIATMTVDEFYEQKVKEGSLSESVHGAHGGHSMQDWAANPEKDAEDRDREEAEKEQKLEQEDDETIQRMRAMDEWKDDHRRGDGNRHNKG